MQQQNSGPVIIVGAGWAGLAAALQLSREGTKVILLEAAPQAGGRARGIPFGDETVDNGQHLLIGAYQHTLQLLKWLNIPESSVLHRTPLELYALNLKDPLVTVHLKLPSFHPKLQLLVGILNATGLSFMERLKAIQFGKTIFQNSTMSLSDISVRQLLIQKNQPESLIQKLWEPIALAALSTPIEKASAKVFLTVLNTLFTHHQGYSNWLMTKKDLSQLLPNPIIKQIKEQGSSIFYHQRVQKLIIENGACQGVTTATETYRGKAVILATPPHVTTRIVGSHPDYPMAWQPLKSTLCTFHHQPITTVYLRYASPVKLPFPMVGLLNSTLQWAFDRQICGQPNILSGVITGNGVHSEFSHEKLVKKITLELGTFFPHLPKLPVDSRVIVEKQAAFSCEVAIEANRPPNSSPIPQLWLAGDYTETGLPATLESAIQSGIKAAQLILSKNVLFT